MAADARRRRGLAGNHGNDGRADAIYALRMNGQERIVLRLPGMVRLHDISRDGGSFRLSPRTCGDRTLCISGAERGRNPSLKPLMAGLRAIARHHR